MLERKIFFLILIVLASYIMFVKDGFTILTNLTGLTSLGLGSTAKDKEDIKKQADNPDNWDSGGFSDETFGQWEAKKTSSIKSIKEAMATKKGSVI